MRDQEMLVYNCQLRHQAEWLSWSQGIAISIDYQQEMWALPCSYTCHVPNLTQIIIIQSTKNYLAFLNLKSSNDYYGSYIYGSGTIKIIIMIIQVHVALNVAPRLVASRLTEKTKKVYNTVRYSKAYPVYYA